MTPLGHSRQASKLPALALSHPISNGSGSRVGTPAITTQGRTEGDMKDIASLLGRAVRDGDGSAAHDVGAAVGALVTRHPASPRHG